MWYNIVAAVGKNIAFAFKISSMMSHICIKYYKSNFLLWSVVHALHKIHILLVKTSELGGMCCVKSIRRRCRLYSRVEGIKVK